MTARDRLVVIALATVAILALAYIAVVSPERKQAAQIASQIQSARTDLSSAQSRLDQARTDESSYRSAYASVVRLGEAVPSGQEVPSLVYELDHLSNSKNVEFDSIASAGGTGTASAPATTTTTAGFSQLPFTFVFNGSFFNLYDLFNQIDDLTTTTGKDEISVSGRLLTIQSVDLAAATSDTTGSSGVRLTGTVTASAYVLPTGQSVTDGATTTGPTAGAAATAPATSDSAAPAPGTNATTAVVEPVR